MKNVTHNSQDLSKLMQNESTLLYFVNWLLDIEKQTVQNSALHTVLCGEFVFCVLGPTQLHNQWVPGLSPRVK
jgi:hypothetical protein